jgi:hypothetical protein
LLTVEYALSREQDLIGLYRFESCPDYKIKIMKRLKELLFLPYRSDELFVISGCIGIAVLCMLAI